jgi:hypothetical protein
MLQINHRESHDVDLFLNDPQFLGFLDPEKRDFNFEIQPAAHIGDGISFLKFSFQDIGEIDFIVSQSKTAEPTLQREIEGEQVLLETVAEIITKKIVHRGSSIRPRDIFDIAAASEQYCDVIIAALGSYRDEVARTLETLDRLNPEFIDRAISQLAIREGFADVAKTAIERTRQILTAV